jgi:hypothetical protein
MFATSLVLVTGRPRSVLPRNRCDRQQDYRMLVVADEGADTEAGFVVPAVLPNHLAKDDARQIRIISPSRPSLAAVESYPHDLR